MPWKGKQSVLSDQSTVYLQRVLAITKSSLII